MMLGRPRPLWVKVGRIQFEQMPSGVPQKADIARSSRRFAVGSKAPFWPRAEDFAVFPHEQIFSGPLACLKSADGRHRVGLAVPGW